MEDSSNNMGKDVSLRSYFERIIEEHQQAIKVAEQEREKTAVNVRKGLEDAMKSGDDRLEDHIQHQIAQVQASLESLNTRLKERDKRTDDRYTFDQDKFTDFKETVTARFTQVNEFRGALDDLGKLMATMKDLKGLSDKVEAVHERHRDDINKKLSLDRFDATLMEWANWRSTIDQWKDRTMGKGEGVSGTTRTIMTIAVFIATLLGILSFFLSWNNQVKINSNAERIEQIKP